MRGDVVDYDGPCTREEFDGVGLTGAWMNSGSMSAFRIPEAERLWTGGNQGIHFASRGDKDGWTSGNAQRRVILSPIVHANA